MNRLESIKINNNSLTTIDDEVFLDLKLNHLDLSCNRLSGDNFLWPAVNIEYLNLTFNDYKDINASVFENVMTDLWGEIGFSCFHHIRSLATMTTSLVGNPFGCAWLVTDGLASKNVRLGKNYVVSSKLDILKAEGIKCFEDGVNEQKLIVVETKLERNNEVSEINSKFKLGINIFLFSIERLKAIKKICSTRRWQRYKTMISTSGQYCYGCRLVALVCLPHFASLNAFLTSLRGRAKNIESRYNNSPSQLMKSLKVYTERNHKSRNEKIWRWKDLLEIYLYMLNVKISLLSRKRMRKSIRTWERLSRVISEFSAVQCSTDSLLSFTFNLAKNRKFSNSLNLTFISADWKQINVDQLYLLPLFQKIYFKLRQ